MSDYKWYKDWHEKLIFREDSITSVNTVKHRAVLLLLSLLYMYCYKRTFTNTNSDVIGAMLSMLAMRIPASAMILVNSTARTGSPFLVVAPKKVMNGMTPSTAMACSSRGAPSQYYSMFQRRRYFLITQSEINRFLYNPKEIWLKIWQWLCPTHM